MMQHTDWQDLQTTPPDRPWLMTLGASILLTAAMLVVYAMTLAPSVGWGEQATLQTHAALLRLGSAAGDHPLPVAVGHAVSRLPLGGDVAYRVNLASALCGALTVLVVFLCALRVLDRARLGGSPRARLVFAVAGALSLGLGHSLWLRAVTPGPAAVATLLFALVVSLWIRRLHGSGGWTILLAAFLLGLSLAADIGLAVFVPFFLVAGIWLLWRPPASREKGRGRFRRAVLTVESEAVGGAGGEAPLDTGDEPPAGAVDPPIGPGAAGRGVSPRRRTSLLGAVVAVLLAFVIGVLPLDLLGVADLVRTPLRSDFATEILPTAGRPVLAAVEHVARRAVEGRLAPIRPIDEQSAQFTRLGGLLAYNFLLIAGVFGVLGALVLLIRRGAIGTGILLLVLFAVAVAAGVVFPAIDLAGAMLPAWVIFALWVAAGTATLGRARLVWLGPVLAALVVVSPIVVYLLVPPDGEQPRRVRPTRRVVGTRLLAWDTRRAAHTVACTAGGSGRDRARGAEQHRERCGGGGARAGRAAAGRGARLPAASRGSSTGRGRALRSQRRRYGHQRGRRPARPHPRRTDRRARRRARRLRRQPGHARCHRHRRRGDRPSGDGGERGDDAVGDRRA